MKQVLKRLNFFIENNLLHILSNYNEDDFDRILDQRDEVAFSERWMETFDTIEEEFKESKTDKIISDDIRKKVFKLVYSITNHSDLASYISDDYGLIIQSIEIKHNDRWLNSLWLEYKNGNLPHSTLVETEGELIDLI
ncbi:hypothetical protein OIU80_16340 [Flavobacterium sp. LS1R47]|uniref:Uncharacterized protein n=1 Tax=Flavobacterium frigoritolerans TaxID=2987686 RepID=A0A9X3C937_9FLAO|nr:hypothetical protein [Flavobacterium frigoritolerans]MCV9933854.1 hypothetical protein [Flavobacterium frigoritolerans]